MLILIGRGLDLRKPTIERETDSRSILCGFEGAEKPETEAKKGEKRRSWIAEPKKLGSEGESPGRAEVDGRSKPNRISGDNSLRDPPVPIPNTEVKPQHADGTWLETARESRSSPDSMKRKRGRERRAFFPATDIPQ